jgi:hypothetical protein
MLDMDSYEEYLMDQQDLLHAPARKRAQEAYIGEPSSVDNTNNPKIAGFP